jgi:hypothetical protein
MKFCTIPYLQKHSPCGRGIFLFLGLCLLIPPGLYGQINALTPYNNTSTQQLFTPVDPASVPTDTSWLDMFGTANGLYGSPYAIATKGSNLYVGGSFNEAGTQTNLNNIARWDGMNWNRMGTGMNGWVRAIAVNTVGIYAGGSFKTADGKEVNGIARWDGTTWEPLSSGVDGEVYAIAVNGTDVYIGGRFTNAGGQPAPNIAKWTGAHWESLGTGVNGTVNSIAIYGPYICVSGSFSQAGGVTANKLARWDGIRWQSIGSGPNDYVYALAANGSALFAGGQYTIMDGHSAYFASQWTGSMWQSMIDTISGNSIFTVATLGGEVYIGGEFSRINQQPISNIAKWNAVQWQSLGSGVNGIIRGFAVNGLDVYVIGNFSLAGGKSCSNIALWRNPPPIIASFVINGNPSSGGVPATDSVDWTIEAKDYGGNRLTNYANPALPFQVNNSTAGIGQWKLGYTNKIGQYVVGNAIGDSVFRNGILQLRTFMTLAENTPISFSFSDTSGVTGTTPSFTAVSGPIVALDIFPYDSEGISVHGATWNGSDGQPDTVDAETDFPYYIRRYDRYHNLNVIASPIEVIVTSDRSGSINISQSPLLVQPVIPSTARVINRTTDRFQLIALWDGKSFFSDTMIVDNTVEVEQGEDTPAVFLLEQNYPNPFNPITRITFQIPRSSYVSLCIYDAIGREVTTLIHTQLHAGEYETEFSGEDLPSGVYYYRLSMEGFTAVKKMILLK